MTEAGLRYSCAQSEKWIRLSGGPGSLREASQGLSCPFLKTFAAAFPDPTDCPWDSEDAFTQIQDLENAGKTRNEF